MTTYNDRMIEAVIQPVLAPLATISPDGYPCVVPVRFYPDLHFESFSGKRQYLLIPVARGSDMLKNVRRNGKGALTVHDVTDPRRIYVIHGDLEIEEDTDHQILRELLQHYEPDATADALEKWINWDHVILRMDLHGGRTLRLEEPIAS